MERLYHIGKSYWAKHLTAADAICSWYYSDIYCYSKDKEPLCVCCLNGYGSINATIV